LNLKGGLWNRGGSGDVVELGWQLGFGFEAKLTWGDVGEVHPSLYRGIGDGRIKIRIRDKF
jgi:hypothetical protein